MRVLFSTLTFFCVLLFCGLFSAGSADARNEPQYLQIQMPSSLLSDFWNRPVSIFAHVLLPDSYYKEPQRRYPVLYWIQGFDGVGDIDERTEVLWQRPMRALHAEFIIVFLNGMFNGRHTEFADSANNGPWGAALTTEFIPETDAHFRTLADPAHRFAGGHSSGGWSALWLQITYPDLFGGEWSVSPDPVDFKDFVGPNLTRFPPQNFYHDDAGHTYTLDGQSLYGFVHGAGWEHRQFESLNAVFSPRLENGAAASLFDERTGRIDPAIQQYWDTHYDIAEILRTRWSTLGPQLRGKLHIIVGTADEYGLNRSVELLRQELTELGSDAEIDFVPRATHETVFGYRGGLRDFIIGQATSLLNAHASSPTP